MKNPYYRYFKHVYLKCTSYIEYKLSIMEQFVTLKLSMAKFVEARLQNHNEMHLDLWSHFFILLLIGYIGIFFTLTTFR